MRYIIIMIAAMLVGSVNQVWGMDPLQQYNRDKLIEEGKLRKLSEEDLKKSNQEIEELLETKRKSSSPTIDYLIRLHLIAQGFSDGSDHKGD